MGLPKILLVDDNRPVLECRQVTLKRAGFIVMAADSGLSALRIAQSEKPDVVVTDIRMAGMDGYELCRKVRELYEVPVILYSAYDLSEEHQNAARAVGAAVVLTSACRIDELVQAIRSLLREEKEMDPSPSAGVLPALPAPASVGSGRV